MSVLHAYVLLSGKLGTKTLDFGGKTWVYLT